MTAPHLVVVGAGLSGLAAAWTVRDLTERGRLRVTVIDERDRVGGVIGSQHPLGLVAEEGPDSFLARKPAGRTLVEQAGLGEELEGMAPTIHGVHLWIKNRLVPLPAGLTSGVPNQLMPILATPALPMRARLRMVVGALSPVAPMSPSRDFSVGRFFRAHFGNAATDLLIAPLFAGVYAGDLDALSLDQTMPHLRKFTASGGSLYSAARRRARTGKRPARSPFLTLRHGLGSLPYALKAKMPALKFMLGTKVEAIVPGDGDSPYRVVLQDRSELAADAVILAVPAASAVHMTAPVQNLADRLAAFRSASLAVTEFVFPSAALDLPPSRSGFLVPAGQGLTITACTYLNAKFLHGRSEAAAPKYTVLRAFLGRAGGEEIARYAGPDLLRTAESDLRHVLTIRGAAEWSSVWSFIDALPQYAIGHAQRVEAAKAAAASRPGLFLAGNYLAGVGIPDCIATGQAAAQAALAHLNHKAT